MKLMSLLAMQQRRQQEQEARNRQQPFNLANSKVWQKGTLKGEGRGQVCAVGAAAGAGDVGKMFQVLTTVCSTCRAPLQVRNTTKEWARTIQRGHPYN